MQAFTVMEVLINILLTAIIMGMVYFLYVSFVKQIGLFEENISEKNNLYTFCHQLKTDFFNAEEIVNSPNSFKVVFYDRSKVEYTIGKKFLYRTQNSRWDSLEIRHVDREWVLKSNSQEQLLHRLNIETLFFNSPVSCSFYKEYPFINSSVIANGN